MYANILVIGLEESVAAELSKSLSELHHTVFSERCLSPAAAIRSIDRTAAELVFCTAEPSIYEGLLKLLREQGRQVPVVVVSRLPEIDKWLDAMDAGAADYCAPPFESRPLRAIVETTVKQPRALLEVC
jgi:DNA-binding NtrC family response regulator